MRDWLYPDDDEWTPELQREQERNADIAEVYELETNGGFMSASERMADLLESMIAEGVAHAMQEREPEHDTDIDREVMEEIAEEAADTVRTEVEETIDALADRMNELEGERAATDIAIHDGENRADRLEGRIGALAERLDAEYQRRRKVEREAWDERRQQETRLQALEILVEDMRRKLRSV